MLRILSGFDSHLGRLKECIMFKLGDDYPVWWNTNRPYVDGWYPATIIKITPYTGRYNFTHVLRLVAPNTRRGWLEMVVR